MLYRDANGSLNGGSGSSINDGSWHGREGIWRSSWWAMDVYNTDAGIAKWEASIPNIFDAA